MLNLCPAYILKTPLTAVLILSCILEFKTEENKLLSVINALRDIAKSVNTVFSVGCISRCKLDGTAPVKAMLDEAGIFYRPNGKINIGLGRPLAPYLR